jgi:hypothetical protein
MFAGVSLFDEDNGTARWDFDHSGRLLRGDYFPRALSNLDQSVNQAFSTDTSLIVVAREQTRSGLLTWIGLYKHADERRSGKGTRGAGIWLLNAVANGQSVLDLLHALADKLVNLGGSNSWSQRSQAVINDSSFLIDQFKRRGELQGLETVELDHPETSCLIDLSNERDDIEFAPVLERAQMPASFNGFKRIFLSDDRAVSEKLTHWVNRTYRGSAEIPGVQASLAVQPDQYAVSVPEKSAPMPNPEISLARVKYELDQIISRRNLDYTDITSRFNQIDQETRIRDRGMVWVGAPLLLFCVLVSGAQLMAWVGIFGSHDLTQPSMAVPPPAFPPTSPASASNVPAASETHPSGSGVAPMEASSRDADKASKPADVAAAVPPPGSDERPDKLRRIMQFNRNALKLLLPAEKQKLSSAEIGLLRDLIQQSVNLGETGTQ